METKPQPLAEPEALRERLNQELNALPPGKYLKLMSYATWRMKPLGHKANGRAPQDLLQDALLATLEGRRHWRDDVDLFRHLIGVMRSISTAWRKKVGEELLESDLATDENERPLNSLVAASDPEKSLIADEELKAIQALFAKDIVCLVILDHLRNGLPAKKSQELLNLEASEYCAAVKKIRRRLARFKNRQLAVAKKRKREPEPVR